MGCNGLLDVSWGIWEDNLVVDIIQPERGGILNITIRAKPEKWRAVYWFKPGAKRAMKKNQDYMEGEFRTAANPKEGYQVMDMIKQESRDMVGFLNPILHPTKLRRVVAKVVSTILGSLQGRIEVDWAFIIVDIVGDLVVAFWKGKKTGSPLLAYLSHLHNQYSLLNPKEEESYLELVHLLQYGGEEPSNRDPSEGEESEDKEETSPLKR